jgi:hypothetical protein
MTAEIDPTHPELLTCAWISLPVRAGSFPLLMGQTKTPQCLLNGEAYLLGKKTKGDARAWETVERTAHASKQRLKEQVLATIASGGPARAAETLERWSQEHAQALVEQLQASEAPSTGN